MNKELNRELKALNIRDYENKPEHRQAMGYFKHTAYKLGITQAELLKRLQSKSLEQINKDYDFEKGNCMEISVKPLVSDIKVHKVEYQNNGTGLCSCGAIVDAETYDLHMEENR